MRDLIRPARQPRTFEAVDLDDDAILNGDRDLAETQASQRFLNLAHRALQSLFLPAFGGAMDFRCPRFRQQLDGHTRSAGVHAGLLAERTDHERLDSLLTAVRKKIGEREKPTSHFPTNETASFGRWIAWREQGSQPGGDFVSIGLRQMSRQNGFCRRVGRLNI